MDDENRMQLEARLQRRADRVKTLPPEAMAMAMPSGRSSRRPGWFLRGVLSFAVYAGVTAMFLGAGYSGYMQLFG